MLSDYKGRIQALVDGPAKIGVVNGDGAPVSEAEFYGMLRK